MVENIIYKVDLQNLSEENSIEVKKIIFDLLKIIYDWNINDVISFIKENNYKFNDLNLNGFKLNDSLNIFNFEDLLKELSMTWLLINVDLEVFLWLKKFKDWNILNDDEYFYKWIRESQFIFEQILWKIVVYEQTSHFTNSFKAALRYSQWRNIDTDSSWLILYINKNKLLLKNILVFDYNNWDYKIANSESLINSDNLFLASKEYRESILELLGCEWVYSNHEIIPLDCIDYIKRVNKKR